MTESPDLILLPLRKESASPGDDGSMLATVAPKRPARGRSSERLILHLAIRGNASFSQEARQQMLNSLATLYFRSSGSATKAEQAAIDVLNKDLLARNMQTARQGLRAIGLMNMLVVRNDRLYLAQCGPVHTYLVRNGEITHFFDTESSGRGLGMARVAPMRYHYASLQPGDRLLVTADPPAQWDTRVIETIGSGSMRSVYWELIGAVEDELDALLIDVQTGDGGLRKLTPRNLPSPTTIIEETPEPEPGEETQPESVIDVSPEPEVETVPFDEKTETPAPVAKPALPAEPAPVIVTAVEDEAESPTPVEPKRARPKKTTNVFQEQIAPALVTFLRAVATTLTQFGKTMGTFARRLLPDENLFNMPNSVMAFIAVAVPLVVITIASVVYSQRGRGYLYAEYFNAAVTTAQLASDEDDPEEQRLLWNQVKEDLRRAELYQETDDSRQLAMFADQILDDLDRVERIRYMQAIPDGLPREVDIVKMVATNNDLYLLDAIEGSILRAVRRGNTYYIDEDFYCGPVPAPDIVGPLVDISTLPVSDPSGATIMGMDADGVLVKCSDTGGGVFTIPMGTPATNWGEPSAMTMNSMDLYVLDSLTSSVWVYWGADPYSALPSYFFGNEVPTMGDVIDITVRDQDLFLLHADSRVTKCTYGLFQNAPTLCTDPMTYKNLPAGIEAGAVFTGRNFEEFEYIPPPEPSLFMLDGETRSIYRFSLQLSFDRQYKPLEEISDQPATAFAINPTREIFLAVGNQVYYSILP